MKPYYQDDSCTIYHGDCREILPALDPVDLVLTDPPYDAKKTHANHLSTVVDRDGLGFVGISPDTFREIVLSLVEKSRRWVIVTCDFRHAAAVLDVDSFVRLGVWIKPDAAPQFTGDRPGMGWEPVAILHRPGRKKWNGGGHHAVWTHACERGAHPTQKPIKLIGQIIRLFSDKGEIVADPFMGSGTTLRAAKDLGRKAIGIEIEEKYCEIAAKRLSQEVFNFSRD